MFVPPLFAPSPPDLGQKLPCSHSQAADWPQRLQASIRSHPKEREAIARSSLADGEEETNFLLLFELRVANNRLELVPAKLVVEIALAPLSPFSYFLCHSQFLTVNSVGQDPNQPLVPLCLDPIFHEPQLSLGRYHPHRPRHRAPARERPAGSTLSCSAIPKEARQRPADLERDRASFSATFFSGTCLQHPNTTTRNYM